MTYETLKKMEELYANKGDAKNLEKVKRILSRDYADVKPEKSKK